MDDVEEAVTAADQQAEMMRDAADNADNPDNSASNGDAGSGPGDNQTDDNEAA